MRIRKICWVVIVAAFVVLVAVYTEFQNSNRVEESAEEESDVIRVLAPYETKLHQQILQQVAKEYSREDGMPQLVFEFVPREKMKKELSMRSLAGKEKVDVVICDNTLMPELIEMGILKELFINQELEVRVKKSQMWLSTRRDGKYYGIPFTCDPYVLFYRKDMLENHQLDVPVTWEELLECGEAVQKSGVKSIGIAGKRTAETARLYQLMINSRGGSIRGISQTVGIETFDIFRKMARQGLISKDMMNYTQEDLAREFAEGKICMMINQMSAASILRTSQISFSVGVGRIPDDIAGGVYLYGDNIGLTADADSRAWDFVRYLIEPDVSERICNAMDTLPVFEDVEYQENKKIYLEEGVEILEDARLLEVYNTWTQISEAIAQGIYEMVENNQADSQQVAEEVYELVRAAIISG